MDGRFEDYATGPGRLPPLSQEVLLEGTTLCAPDLEPAARASSVAFRILGELGQGGMGMLYRAEQVYPRRTVALKVLKRNIQEALQGLEECGQTTAGTRALIAHALEAQRPAAARP